MNRIFDIALKDIRQTVRDRMSLLFLLILPLVFTLFMGFAFSSTGSTQDNLARFKVGYASLDPYGALTVPFLDMLKATGLEVELVVDDQIETARTRVQSGDLDALVILPSGFSKQLLEAGNLMTVEIVVDESDLDGQQVAQFIRSAHFRTLNIAQVSRLGVETSRLLKPFSSESERRAALDSGAQQAAAAWASPPLSVFFRKTASQQAAEGAKPNPYSQTSPGMLVQFVIAGVIGPGMVLMLERKNGALQRLLTTTLRRSEIIAGHLLAMFLIVLIQQLLLILFGQFVLGLNYLRQPLATLLIAVAVSLWVACMGLFIGVMARTEDQVILFALIFMFLFTALGGAWFPLEVSGAAFSTIGHLTPAAWAMDGYQNIILRGLDFSSALLPAAVLIGYAGLFFVLAVWRFRKA
ncbi:MAG TPA: ABC transporter permease [Anaerolineaceae bacterium]|nr:ABC transporter permease [Anaerolineaceae bacterium]